MAKTDIDLGNAYMELQQLATFLRNAAYADNQTHYIDWHLSVVFPDSNDGDIYFGGGLWNHSRVKAQRHNISLSFSYSHVKGIHNIKKWKDGSEIFMEKDSMKFGEFKDMVIMLFSIEKLYEATL